MNISCKLDSICSFEVFYFLSFIGFVTRFINKGEVCFCLVEVRIEERALLWRFNVISWDISIELFNILNGGLIDYGLTGFELFNYFLIESDIKLRI